jgi:SAM-dependent methyltransferase
MPDSAQADNLRYYASPKVVENLKDHPYYLRDIEAALVTDAINRIGKPTSDLRLLDLGCGHGRTSLPLASLGLTVTALDLSYPLIHVAHTNKPDLEVLCANAVHLPVADNTFDIVLFSHNGIDLIAPTELRFAALREVVRALRPEGFFVYSSHALPLIPYNRQTLGVAIYNLVRGRLPFKAGYFEEIRSQHGGKLTWYAASRPAIQRELESCGMRLLRHSKINFIESAPRTAVLALLSWERYTLAQVVS